MAFCGDGLVDPDGKETCYSCPQDSPCPTDKRCDDGSCIATIVPPLFLEKDPSATIIIPRTIANKLNEYYNNEFEFVACLEGKYREGVYQITDTIIPKIVEVSRFHTVHTGCPKYRIAATIHSHPGGECKLSDIDIYTFGKRKDPLSAVICGKDNFAFYSSKNFDLRMNYLIRDVEDRAPTLFIILVLLITLFIGLLVIFTNYRINKFMKQYKRKKALHIMKQFTEGERKIVSIFLDIGTIRLKNLPKSVEDKLILYKVVHIKGKKY